MADPTNPVDPNTVNDMNDIATATTNAQAAFTAFGSAADSVKSVLGGVDKTLKDLQTSMQQNQALTENQTELLGLASIAALGAKKSFEAFGSVDFRGLSTFSGQLHDLKGILVTSQGGISKLAEVAYNTFGVIIPDAVKNKGTSAVLDFMENLVTSADNALRLQTAYVQLAAQTGGLKDVYDAAGESLEKINLLVEQQQNIIQKAGQATNKSADEVTRYYMELGQVPKALQSTVEGAKGMNSNISLLTASIQLSEGAGRKYSEVVDDLREAFRDYNLTGEEALQFTARMTELSNKFGVELQDIRSSLRNSAEAFKMFGNESEAAVRILNNYVGALQNTGISGATAVDIVSNMTNKIKDLTIAQKGFLSAQTGGPGGLMGAFQIEQMLRSGKLDEVFEKVKSSMQKQFGNIVGLNEAASSPAAASQLTRQMLMLRSGPLGQFARSDQEAIRILEAFKQGSSGQIKASELIKDVNKEYMGKGIDIQQKSYTELSRIRSLLEQTQGIGNIAGLNLLQQSTTAGTGTPMSGADFGAKMRDNLISFATKGAIEGGKVTEEYVQEISSKALVDMSGNTAVEVMKSYGEFFKQLPDALKAPLNKVKDLFSLGKNEAAETEVQSLLADIAQRKEALNKSKLGNKKQELMQLDKEQKDIIEMAAYYKTLGTTGGNTNLFGAGLPSITSYDDLGAAKLGTSAIGVANTNFKTGATPITAGPTMMMGPNADVTSGKMGEITVHVKGYCLRCKQDIEGGDQLASVSPVAKAYQ